jgi:ABC-2 type transport system permease protein
MRAFLTLWRKEFASYFISPIAYIVLAVFTAGAGLNFWRMCVQNLGSRVEVPILLFGPILFWVMIIAVITAVTMRVFSEEKRAGTIEMLVTAPIRETATVLAKYAGAYSFFLVICLSSLLFLVVLRLTAAGIGPIDWGPIAGGYLILLLVGACYIAIGTFVSALTKNPIVAIVVTFSVLGVLFFWEFFGSVVSVSIIARIGDYIAPTRHILEFARGLIDTRPIVLYLSATVFMLFMTVRVLESERWR